MSEEPTKNILVFDQTGVEENVLQKYCKDCDKILPRTMFHKQGKSVFVVCGLCRSIREKKDVYVLREGTKYCKGCEKDLPRTDFKKDGKYESALCKPCGSKSRKARRYPRTDKDKYCNGCCEIHNAICFNSNVCNLDGLDSICKNYSSKKQAQRLSTFDGRISNLYCNIKTKADTRQLTFSIEKSDIINLYNDQNGLCNLSGIKMTYENLERTKNDTYILNIWNISVDRIDSNKNYDLNNIQLVCNIINRFKTTLPQDDFLLFCGVISQNNSVEKDINIYPILKLFDYRCITETNQAEKTTNMQRYGCKMESKLRKLHSSTIENKRGHEGMMTKDDIFVMYNNQKGR